MSAPVILFVYNRKMHTERMLKYLDKQNLASETDLYIFCDGCKRPSNAEKIQEVRSVVRKYKEKSNFRNVIITESQTNKGLARSVIEGVTDVLRESEEVIVLEDDLIISGDYLGFMNQALQYYKGDKRINSIGGYIADYDNDGIIFDKDIYFSGVFECWGWAIWRDRWNSIEWSYDYWKSVSKTPGIIYNLAKNGGVNLLIILFDYLDGRNDSWAVRAACDQIIKGTYTVLPTKTKIVNEGFDGSGTNCIKEDRQERVTNDTQAELCPFYEDRNIQKKMIKLRSSYSSYKRLFVGFLISWKKYLLHMIK